MEWVRRSLESALKNAGNGLHLFPVWLLLGPRQVGKSSLLLHIRDTNRQIISLDELSVRMRARENPELFAKSLSFPLIIDEIQYAPELLSVLKQKVDAGLPPGSIWLTGSQSFQLMQGVRESLAGRVAIIYLKGFSYEEKRRYLGRPEHPFHSLVETRFPKLFGVTSPDERSLYLSSYVQTHLERDVAELVGLKKRREFEIFLRMCAMRSGQLVNQESLASDVGVSGATIREWLKALEATFLLKLVQTGAFSANKRLVKTPKLFFCDAGLAAWLAGWKTLDQAQLGPMNGALFETMVFNELQQAFENRLRDFQIWFWRTRDGQEIDFLVESRGRIVPVEVKMGIPKAQQLPHLKPIAEPSWTNGICCSLAHSDKTVPISDDWSLCSFDNLVEEVLECVG